MAISDKNQSPFYWEIILYYLQLNTCKAIPTKDLRLETNSTGQVAQSVEQRPEKPCVAGSIPALSTGNKQYVKISKY